MTDDLQIPEYPAFPLMQRGHIFEKLDEQGRSVGRCGIVALREIPTRPIRMDDPALCQPCLAKQAEAEWIEEPIEDAVARGVKLVGEAEG